MIEVAALTEADFRANPVLFVELAHTWAGGGMPPEPRHEDWLYELPRPRFSRPALAREALWGALSYPERGRALTWLDQTGLLAELLPAWDGSVARRALRLAAVEEVHLERWAGGLGNLVYEWLCVFQDQRVGRLGGWALTGLATLLLEGDEPAAEFAKRVDADLAALGAMTVESERVVAAIGEYPELKAALTTGELPARNFSPMAIVATLSSLMAMPELSMHTLRGAIKTTDTLLLRFAAPHTPEDRSVR